jgi:hypothetical protein
VIPADMKNSSHPTPFYRNGLCLLYEAAVTFTLPSKAKRKLIDKSPIKNVNLWGIGNILVSILTG